MQNLPFINVGKIISELLENEHMTKKDLADEIGISQSNAVYLTKRESIDVRMLWKIGTALRYNFWKHYPIDGDEDDDTSVVDGKNKLIAELNAKVAAKEKVIEELRQELVKQEIGFLKEINGLLKKKG